MSWTLDLKGKVSLVTGGARGIGRALVVRLRASGSQVAWCCRTEASLAEAEEFYASLGPGPKVSGCIADVGRRESVHELFAWVDREFGALDVLVNNAGLGIFAPLEKLSEEDFDSVISTNLTGAFLCMKQAVPRLKARGGGWIVNISSLAGKNPFAGGAAYNASKFGLNGMTEATMLDHRYEGVRAVIIAPGSVNTDFGHTGPADWKIGPEDVAETVAWVLASPARTLISHVEIRPAQPRR